MTLNRLIVAVFQYPVNNIGTKAASLKESRLPSPFAGIDGRVPNFRPYIPPGLTVAASLPSSSALAISHHLTPLFPNPARCAGFAVTRRPARICFPAKRASD